MTQFYMAMIFIFITRCLLSPRNSFSERPHRFNPGAEAVGPGSDEPHDADVLEAGPAHAGFFCHDRQSGCHNPPHFDGKYARVLSLPAFPTVRCMDQYLSIP